MMQNRLFASLAIAFTILVLGSMPSPSEAATVSCKSFKNTASKIECEKLVISCQKSLSTNPTKIMALFAELKIKSCQAAAVEEVEDTEDEQSASVNKTKSVKKSGKRRRQRRGRRRGVWGR